MSRIDEQIRKYVRANLWYLFPLLYAYVNKFNDLFGESDRVTNLLPLLFIQGFVTIGLLYWGFQKFTESTARRAWIWIQIAFTAGIYWISIPSQMAGSKWLSIALHIVLPLIWFLGFYKFHIVTYEVPPMLNPRSKK